MSFDGQTLFNLLPALYRLRDAQLAQSQNLLTPRRPHNSPHCRRCRILTVVQQQQLDQLLAKAARGPAAIAADADRGANRGRRRGPRPALRRSVHRDLRPLGDSVYRRSDRLPVGQGRGAGRRQPSRRGRAHHLVPTPQRHRAGARATRARRHRMGRARGRVLQGAGRHPVHEPHPAAQLLRARSAAMGTAGLHGHWLRRHRSHGGRPAHRLANAAATTSRTSASSSGR